MSIEQLQAEIDSITWYHEFDFGNGLRAHPKSPPTHTHREIWKFIEAQLSQIDFHDKTVLDIGCWDGYWSFHAERRGAKSVLATDDFSQNWSNAQGVLLAKQLLGSAVELEEHISVYDLASLDRKFDIILFLGVYYHLLDPFYALAQIRQCCHPNSLVLIEGAEGFGLPPDAAIFDPNDRVCKFLPTSGHLKHLLSAAYFSVVSESFSALPPGYWARGGWTWRLRMCLESLRGSQVGVAQLVRSSAPLRRAFITCVPMQGENPLHSYPPPFGLARYDTRFCAERGAVPPTRPIKAPTLAARENSR
jgi:tRNA (mo5U34)-methyltransferase